jgi:hypothetical protein
MFVRFSGYDPRAAGGRQTLKLELRADLAPSIRQISFHFRSELISTSQREQILHRTPSGVWPPLMLSFSSKYKEHGQYPLEVQLHYQDHTGDPHLWTCTATILLPRSNASLSEIHQVFLATQKNVRVLAEDGAIAKLSGLQHTQDSRHANLDIAIYAKDAAIAQLDMSSSRSNDGGKFELGLSSLAWDEELIEVAVPHFQNLIGMNLPPATEVALTAAIDVQPNTASLVAKTRATIRLFALKEWVLGRMDAQHPVADILLHHDDPKLTRRISAKHAILRRTDNGGVEIIDTSRYGVIVDGIILEKNQPMQLFTDMQIDFCANIKGIVQLRIAQIFPHALVLQKIVDTQVSELLYLISPELRPEAGIHTQFHAPIFFHRHGQFWFHDQQALQDHRLETSGDLSSYHEHLHGYQFSHVPYHDRQS